MNVAVVEVLTHYAEVCLRMSDSLQPDHRDMQRERAYNVLDAVFKGSIEPYLRGENEAEVGAKITQLREQQAVIIDDDLPPMTPWPPEDEVTPFPGNEDEAPPQDERTRMRLITNPNASDGESLKVPERSVPHPMGADSTGPVACTICRRRLESLGDLADHIRDTHPPT